MQYEDDLRVILENVGGIENITRVYHCVTRLRFNLKDTSLINKAAIDATKLAKGSVLNAGQYQVIIGAGTVDEAYDEFLRMTGLADGGSIDVNEDEAPAEKKNLVGMAIDLCTNVLIPALPALVTGGITKAVLLSLLFGGVIDPTSPTYGVLMMISDAPFYFLPIILAFTSAKYFGCNQVAAMVLGCIMLHPSFAELGDGANLFGLPIPYVAYSSTVFPVIIGVYVMSWVEKLWKRIVPKMVAGFFVPMLTIFTTAPIVLAAVGPVINLAANAAGSALVSLVEFAGVFGAAIVSGIYPLMVFTGLHQALGAFEVQSLAQVGYDPFLPLGAAANAAIAGATFALAFLAKEEDSRSLAFTSGISAIIGITEPALYGVVAPAKAAFVSTFIGGAAGGALMSLFGVKAYAMGPVPLAGIAIFLGDTFVQYLIAVVVSVVVAAVATIALTKAMNGRDA
ncbi:MAG: PTS transporter subunit EIIC [Atopobiaceae bacterium]|nr:PTS transporter subunit EIIC [Atopobiaceae bacterium]